MDGPLLGTTGETHVFRHAAQRKVSAPRFGSKFIALPDVAQVQGHWPLAQGHLPLAQRHLPLGKGHSPLAKGHSPLAKGHSPLAKGHSPLAKGHSHPTFFYLFVGPALWSLLVTRAGGSRALLTNAQLERLETELPKIYRRLAAHAARFIKRARAQGITLPTGAEKGDLVQGAVAALIDTRSWPDGIELPVVLRKIITSLGTRLLESGASREVPLERQRQPGAVDDERSFFDDDEHRDFFFDDAEQPDLAADAPYFADELNLDPEALLIKREQYQQMLDELTSALDGDDIALQIAKAMLEGERRPSDIAERLGLEVNVVENGIKRAKRRLEDLAILWRKR